MKYLLALLLTAPALLCALPTQAEQEADEAQERVSPLSRIGVPASPDGVRLALDDAKQSGEQARTALAFLLGEAGGRAAAEGLAELSADRSPRVRMAALRTAARLGLRTHDLAEHARRALRSHDLDMRLSALEALGGLGDGRDVPRLLDLVLSDTAEIRTASYRALRKLTGLRIPNDHPRWTYWWRTTESRTVQHLDSSLDSSVDSLEELSPSERIALRDLGWIRVPALADLLRDWLRRPDSNLRLEACALVAQHRLADLGPDVELALRYAKDETVESGAAIALEVLGITPQEELRRLISASSPR